MAETEKVVMRRVGVMSMAKVYTIIFAIVGLFYGAFFALAAGVIGSAAGLGGLGAGLGALAIVIMPFWVLLLMLPSWIW